MNHINYLLTILSIFWSHDFILAGRTRERIIKFLNISEDTTTTTEKIEPTTKTITTTEKTTTNTPTIIYRPPKNPFKIQDVRLFIRPGVDGGYGYDRVTVQFQSIPSFTDKTTLEIGQEYFLAVKPCLADQSQYTVIETRPLAEFPAGERVKMHHKFYFSPQITSLSMEFRFGHKYANSSDAIDFVDIQSIACKRQLFTGEKPLYIPPFVVKVGEKEEMPLKVAFHYAKFDNGLTVPDHLIYKISFQSCYPTKEWQSQKIIYVGWRDLKETLAEQTMYINASRNTTVRILVENPETKQIVRREIWTPYCFVSFAPSKVLVLDVSQPEKIVVHKFGTTYQIRFNLLNQFPVQELAMQDDIKISHYSLCVLKASDPDTCLFVSKFIEFDQFDYETSVRFTTSLKVDFVRLCAETRENFPIACGTTKQVE